MTIDVGKPVAKMMPSDLGLIEYTCQSGRGDPPMDCIYPDCPCGQTFLSWWARNYVTTALLPPCRAIQRAHAVLAIAEVSDA